MSSQTSAMQNKRTPEHSATEHTDIPKCRQKLPPPKQQKGVKLSNNDNNTKDTLYPIYESSKNFDSFSFSIAVRDIPNRICMTASKFEKEVSKIGHRSSRSLRRMWPFHVVFCKERQRNE